MTEMERSTTLPWRKVLPLVPGPKGERSVTQFRHGTLEVKFSAPLAPNDQIPHTQDELYCVVRGHGYLWHDGKRDPCGPGDLLFVSAGTEHHFEEFSEDFRVWVIYYGPDGGEVVAQPGAPADVPASRGRR